MNEEIRDATSIALRLARECGGFGSGEEFVVSFYKAAFNAGLLAAGKAVDAEIEMLASNTTRDEVQGRICALEMR